MQEIIEQALKTFELTDALDGAQVAQSREKVTRYIDSLISAGQSDPHRLSEYARAYLKEMLEGPDPRFTGW